MESEDPSHLVSYYLVLPHPIFFSPITGYFLDFIFYRWFIFTLDFVQFFHLNLLYIYHTIPSNLLPTRLNRNY